MTFLVARPSPKAESTQLALQTAGFEAEIAPVLQVKISSDSTLRDKFSENDFDILIITSTYAVDWLTQQALTINLNSTILVCIGQSTANKLLKNLFHDTHKKDIKNALILPQTENSEGVLALPIMQNVDEKHILLLKGEGGRQLIQQGLEARGAHLNELCVYRRSLNRDHAFDFKPDTIKCIIATSVDIAIACFALFETNFLRNIHWIVASQRIKDYAIQQGVVSIFESQGASQSAIVKCAQHLVHTGVVND